jgi:hypothetical protein
VSGLIEAIAYLVPVLLLLALVAGGRYPGERAYARRVAHARVARPWRAARVHRRRRLWVVELPRGGALLASGLAGRAPPPVAC